jgi:hypothetical protein
MVEPDKPRAFAILKIQGITAAFEPGYYIKVLKNPQVIQGSSAIYCSLTDNIAESHTRILFDVFEKTKADIIAKEIAVQPFIGQQGFKLS